MKVEYVLNNYQMGAKLKTCPIDKIIKQERVDRTKTIVVFSFNSEKEKQFVDRVLAKKGKIVG